jgi:hypothetical protein
MMFTLHLRSWLLLVGVGEPGLLMLLQRPWLEQRLSGRWCLEQSDLGCGIHVLILLTLVTPAMTVISKVTGDPMRLIIRVLKHHSAGMLLLPPLNASVCCGCCGRTLISLVTFV